MERIKASFERTGDADLSDAGDMMAVAGVLKLFLRELPDAVIPEHMTRQFVNTQEGQFASHFHIPSVVVFVSIFKVRTWRGLEMNVDAQEITWNSAL